MSKNGKICLMYTGGTIGMVTMPDGTLRPPDDPNDFLNLAPELPDIVNFDFLPLMNKDSTNMSPIDWTTIANAIYEKRKGYSGFVIAHGTDTMHFTSSAVAFALGDNLNFPVVFTGAQTTPEVEHGDARVNLLRAFKVAQENIAEVVISFGDYVFRGCRAQKKDERKFDAFESPAMPPLGYITKKILLTNLAHKKKEHKNDIELNASFEKGILQVSLIPGLEPELLIPIIDSEICNGVILQSFGAGNVPDAEPYSFSEVISHAVDNNKPVIITSQFPAGGTMDTSYEPGRKAINAGAIPTGNMTASCAASKFRWVLAQVNKSIANGSINEKDRISEVNTRMQHIYIDEMD